MNTTIGIIIIFDHLDHMLSADEFIQNFNLLPDVTFCLVNNTKEETFGESLLSIADCCDNVTVVNNKKRSSKTGVRYGKRYLNSQYNLKYFSYIHHKNYINILKTLNQFYNNINQLKTALSKEKSSGAIQKSFERNINSLPFYIMKLNNDLGSLSKSC